MYSHNLLLLLCPIVTCQGVMNKTFLLVWAKNSTLINTNMYLKCIHEFSKHTRMCLDQLEHSMYLSKKIKLSCIGSSLYSIFCKKYFSIMSWTRFQMPYPNCHLCFIGRVNKINSSNKLKIACFEVIFYCKAFCSTSIVLKTIKPCG